MSNPLPPESPTGAKPGSSEKIEILRQRVEAGLPIFVAGDRVIEHELVDLERLHNAIESFACAAERLANVALLARPIVAHGQPKPNQGFCEHCGLIVFDRLVCKGCHPSQPLALTTEDLLAANS